MYGWIFKLIMTWNAYKRCCNEQNNLRSNNKSRDWETRRLVTQFGGSVPSEQKLKSIITMKYISDKPLYSDSRITYYSISTQALPKSEIPLRPQIRFSQVLFDIPLKHIYLGGLIVSSPHLYKIAFLNLSMRFPQCNRT